METSLGVLCQLQQLQHLDISQCKEARGVFHQPRHFLASLVSSLARLQSLDISGQHLLLVPTQLYSAFQGPTLVGVGRREWSVRECNVIFQDLKEGRVEFSS